MIRRAPLSLALALTAVACAAPASTEEVSDSEGQLVTDIVTMEENADGTFRVTCRGAGGSTYVEPRVSADDVRGDRVCRSGAAPADPFDPASCAGDALTAADALAMADFDPAAGRTRSALGSLSLSRRERDCYPGFACSPWRAPTGQAGLELTGSYTESSTMACGYLGRARCPFTRHLTAREVVKVSEATLSALVGTTALALTANRPEVRFGAAATIDAPWGNPQVSAAPLATFSGKLSLRAAGVKQYQAARLVADASDPKTASGVDLTGKVTATCARFQGRAEIARTDADGNAFKREVEIVLYGTH